MNHMQQQPDAYGYVFNGELPPDLQLSEVLFPSSGHLAGSQAVGTQNVDAVLSAAHYPVPQGVRIRNLFSDSHGSTLSVNDFLGVLERAQSAEAAPAIPIEVEDDVDAEGDFDVGLEPTPAHTRLPTSSPIQQPARAKHSQPRKKPGRPRLAIKNGADGENSTSERRRKQLREAQRGYRMRKESRISDLVRRVAQLESSLDNIVTSVVSLTEQITQSGALADHVDLSSQLSSVLQICLSSIKESSGTDSEEYNETGLPSPPVQLPLPSPLKTHLTAPMPISVYSARHAILTPPSSTGNAVMLPDFINNLIFSILYYGYTMLADPATPWERLVRHFQLVLPTVGRERMTSYFATAFHAKISREKRLEGWKEVPLFSLGGAGTHYSTETETREGALALRHPEPQPYRTISTTADAFPSTLYEEVEGDWFDFADLLQFLRERSPDLRTSASAPAGFQTGSTDATLLARALVRKTTCLGRSAGFRRRDVEDALQAATMT